MVKLEAASISNHKVLIVAEETKLSVYRSAHMIECFRVLSSFF